MGKGVDIYRESWATPVPTGLQLAEGTRPATVLYTIVPIRQAEVTSRAYG